MVQSVDSWAAVCLRVLVNISPWLFQDLVSHYVCAVICRKTPSLDADVAANLGEIGTFAAASRCGHACVYVSNVLVTGKTQAKPGRRKQLRMGRRAATVPKSVQ